MRRNDGWCSLCGGQGFVSEFDRDWTPEQRAHLFAHGRTAVCTRCNGSGREPPPQAGALMMATIIAGLAFVLGMAAYLFWRQVAG